MGYSGLIYAAIVAAWAAFLVPRWVRRNEEVERAREVDAARRVRVLSRKSGPPQAPHGPVTVPSPATPEQPVHHDDSETRVTAPEHRTDHQHAAVPADVFARAARRRRRMLGVLVVLLAAAVALTMLGRAPGWMPAAPAALLMLFLVLARRAAVAQARRRRVEARRRGRVRPHAAAADAAVVWAPGTASDGAAETSRRLVLPDEITAAVAADDGAGWSPVPVPLPTYLTKPKATRPVARKIDLSQPGAWTSGRLDPASSIQLPRRDSAEPPAAVPAEPETAAPAEEIPVEEHRRAVGD